MRRIVLSGCGALIALGIATAAPAATLTGNRATFLADPAVTSPVVVDFDGLVAGTNITGSTLNGATFDAPGATPLTIVNAAGLPFAGAPTTGLNALSPGGSLTTLEGENDDLAITFATPQRAVGLDILLPLFSNTLTTVTFFDASGNNLANTPLLAFSGTGGSLTSQFVGYISDSANINRILIDDVNAPGVGGLGFDNIAFDSLVFSTGPTVTPPVTPPGDNNPPIDGNPIPLPGAGLMGLALMSGFSLLRRRR